MIGRPVIRRKKTEDSPNLPALSFFFLYFHVFYKPYDVPDSHYVLNLQSRVSGCILDMKLIFNC